MRVDDIMVTGLPRRGTSSFILQPSCLPKADVILPERAAGGQTPSAPVNRERLGES